MSFFLLLRNEAIVLERASGHVGSHFEFLSTQPLNPDCNILAVPVFFHWSRLPIIKCICAGDKLSIESKLIPLNVSHL